MTKKVTLYLAAMAAVVALILIGYVKGTEQNYLIRFEPGKTYTYGLEYTSDASGHASGYAEAANLIASSINVDYAFKGKMHIHVIEENALGYQLEFSFDADTFKASINEEVNWVWPKDIVATGVLSKDGHLSGLEFQERYFAEFSPVLKEWIGQFQVSLTNDGKANWQTVEGDFTSDYDVSYRLQEGSSPTLDTTILKEYIALNPQVRMNQSTNVVISRFFKRIEQIQTNRERSTFSANRLMAKESMSLSLNYLFQSKIADTRTALVGQVVKDTLAGHYQKTLLKTQMYENTLSNADPDTFKGRLRATPSYGNKERSQLFFELRAWVALDSSKLAQIEEWMRMYNASHPSFQMLSALLVNIGSPEAQQILLDVLNTSSVSKQQAIMLKLAFLKEPTQASVDAVQTMSRTLFKHEDQVQAKLVLGSMANNLLDRDEDRANKLYEQFELELSQASDASDIADSLSVLGNIGSPNQTDKVTPFLSHENKSVRHAAVNSLRFVNTPEAQSVLLGSLEAEDERVREIASAGLSFTTPRSEFVQVYKERLFAETNQQVIKQLVDLLGNMAVQYPEAIDVLEEYIPTIGITSLKNYAENVLEQARI
ncbi:HEAT repeat domain-containing protein [Vibrio nigripulchritudo]|uniref:HEAT repeat domain-containing protein n=1 Tax=Vibrio nigripulchritudo TaxID=28173 RepID=UPI00249372D3|nr:HEAT repeat domain-containing protein [Vibrio nigripulchritudo]BDU38782.1 hypothetical protein TUMSATVNIG2_32510 [Vibrio nigripulchritudo]BDU44502.1 hypothetical protein TUMSATVNIG3_33000 [Vibrio nigripulchritudo]